VLRRTPRKPTSIRTRAAAYPHIRKGVYMGVSFRHLHSPYDRRLVQARIVVPATLPGETKFRMSHRSAQSHLKIHPGTTSHMANLCHAESPVQVLPDSIDRSIDQCVRR
jgi:hypothetical protein